MLKQPHWWKSAELKLIGGHDVLEKQYHDLQATVAGTEIRIPETRFFKVNDNGGYIIAQEYIDADGSIPDMDRFINNQNNTSVSLRYQTSRQNFIAHNGHAYIVDTTKGLDYELVERANLMSENEYRFARERIKNFCKNAYQQLKARLRNKF